MPKRVYVTLSDEAAAILADVPFHSRGAYVSALLAADRGQGATPADARRCKCGIELNKRIYFHQGIWAAGADDLEAYREHQQPDHDVYAGTGKRLRVGLCSPAIGP